MPRKNGRLGRRDKSYDMFLCGEEQSLVIVMHVSHQVVGGPKKYYKSAKDFSPHALWLLGIEDRCDCCLACQAGQAKWMLHSTLGGTGGDNPASTSASTACDDNYDADGDLDTTPFGIAPLSTQSSSSICPSSPTNQKLLQSENFNILESAAKTPVGVEQFESPSDHEQPSPVVDTSLSQSSDHRPANINIMSISFLTSQSSTRSSGSVSPRIRSQLDAESDSDHADHPFQKGDKVLFDLQVNNSDNGTRMWPGVVKDVLRPVTGICSEDQVVYVLSPIHSTSSSMEIHLPRTRLASFPPKAKRIISAASSGWIIRLNVNRKFDLTWTDSEVPTVVVRDEDLDDQAYEEALRQAMDEAGSMYVHDN
jgi:hypothetical protein